MKPYIETGTYLEIDPPHRLDMSETLTNADAGPDLGWTGTPVTVEFLAEGRKTRLILVHEGFPSSEHRDGAGGGWPGFIAASPNSWNAPGLRSRHRWAGHDLAAPPVSCSSAREE